MSLKDEDGMLIAVICKQAIEKHCGSEGWRDWCIRAIGGLLLNLADALSLF